MKTLIIIRHGNTFLKNEIPTRVGCRTDIPLVENEKGINAGKYLLNNNLIIDKIFAAPLLRTMQTAKLIADQLKFKNNIIALKDFEEIDYGLDENQPENLVVERLGLEFVKQNNILNPSQQEIIDYGKNIIDLWNEQAIVPNGWLVDVQKIIETWKKFADNISDNETVLICTSNGIIRFVPYLLQQTDFDCFTKTNSLKVATGSISIFRYDNNCWKCELWNEKP